MKSGTHGFERVRKVCSTLAVATFGLLSLSSSVQAQPVIGRIFSASEFAARRAAVMKSIGDGVAIIQGTTERPGEQPLRQNNEFYYLTGVI
ncbi:MAG TPA: aminopeptidase P N-terminal domain-containing protein, partial [Gemmatimonadaceae bacterium]|nr:aminopeptidase P N-terminal domain-containing protein [Gemmatimonadaceae bacterium]